MLLKSMYHRLRTYVKTKIHNILISIMQNINFNDIQIKYLTDKNLKRKSMQPTNLVSIKKNITVIIITLVRSCSHAYKLLILYSLKAYINQLEKNTSVQLK